MNIIGVEDEFLILVGDSKPIENKDLANSCNENYFDLVAKSRSLCSYKKDGVEQKCICDVDAIRNWFKQYKEHIYNEESFPLNIEANSGLDFYLKSGNYDSDDVNELDSWYTIRQEWYFRHSWYQVNNGSYLADIIFRRTGDEIEITWDNTKLFKGIEFLNPVGQEFIKFELFKSVVESFLIAQT